MNAAAPREDRLSLAVALVLGAFFFFIMIDTSAKWMVGAGLPALQVVFIRYAGHFTATVVFLLPKEGRDIYRSNAPIIQVFRSLLLVVSTMLNFLALKYLPLTVTTAVFFTTPIVVVLLSIPMLGEKVGLKRFLAVLVGFGGVLIVVRPLGASFHWSMLCSLGALMAASVYFVLTRMIAGRDNNPTGQFFTSGIPTMILLPFVISTWTWPQDGWSWVAACLIGVFGFMGHSMITIGHRFAEASTLAPAVYVQVIYVSLISWLIFNQPPDGWTMLGTAVIIGSGVFIWWRERQLRKVPIAMSGDPHRH